MLCNGNRKVIIHMYRRMLYLSQMLIKWTISVQKNDLVRLELKEYTIFVCFWSQGRCLLHLLFLAEDILDQTGEINGLRIQIVHTFIIFRSIDMTNSAKKRTKPSTHSFHILGGSGRLLKEPVEVSFQPQPKSKTNRPRSIVPTFNTDRKYYTLTFRLPSAQSEPDEQLLKEHQKRVMEAQLEIEDILYPKPRSRQKYCGVCKEYYEDYKEHVEGNHHIIKALICEMAERMGEGLGQRRFEDQKTLQSNSEDQLFKCLSIETLTEGSSNKKVADFLQE